MKERANGFLRACDKFLGIGCILFLSLFKRRRKWPKKITTIAFLKSAGIGDTILLSAIIEDVKKTFPQIKITLFTGISNQESAFLIPKITVVPLTILRPLNAIRTIRKQQFDVFFDCDPWPRINALFTFFSHSRTTIGFKTVRQLRHFLYDYSIFHSFKCHELDNYRRLVRPLGLEPTSFPLIKVAPLKEIGCKIALHLFAGGSRAYLKEWPKENWKKLIRFIVQQNIDVLLTGSANDRLRLNEFVIDKRVCNVAGKYSLAQVATVLKGCLCLVSIDTGIMHLASALGIPVVSLHGPTDPNRWGGIGKKVISLTPDLEYTPCIQLGFESKCHKAHCMKALPFEKVRAALEQIILDGRKESESTHFGRRERPEVMATFSKNAP